MKVNMDDLAHSMTDAIELAALKPVLESLSKVVYGQSRNIKLALCCFLSRGHLLLDGVPGVGKTTMAKSLATVLGLDFKRIQCTSDLLPSDVLGYSLYNATSGEMTFQPGPIFSQTLLIDELNRASPKTQSAFLEAMAERQVTLDNMSHPLPAPFFVIATQNPAQQLGTFPLPEAQLDRFLMSVHIDYPSKAAEQLLYREGHKTTVIDTAIDFATLKNLQDKVGDVMVSDAIGGYVHDLVSFSRHNDKFPVGLSPRAGLALIEAAKAWAFLGVRDFVVPEDVQAVLPSVVRHRLQDQTTLGAALVSDQGCIGQYLSDHVTIG